MSLFNDIPTEDELQNLAKLVPLVPQEKVQAAVDIGKRLSTKHFPQKMPQQLASVSFLRHASLYHALFN